LISIKNIDEKPFIMDVFFLSNARFPLRKNVDFIQKSSGGKEKKTTTTNDWIFIFRRKA
jgi:hypothetical protein